MKIIFRDNDVLHIISSAKTTNKKIAEKKETIVQTYHFSRDQFEEAKKQTTMRDFFSHDGAVCLDCPFAVSNGAKDRFNKAIFTITRYCECLICRKWTPSSWPATPRLKAWVNQVRHLWHPLLPVPCSR